MDPLSVTYSGLSLCLMAKLLDLLVEDLVSRAVAESAKDPWLSLSAPFLVASSLDVVTALSYF